MMLASHVPTLVLVCASAFFPVLVGDATTASPWLQLGLGGAALALVGMVLKPLVKSQTDSNKAMSATLTEIAKSQAAATEVQRELLVYAKTAATMSLTNGVALGALTSRFDVKEGNSAPPPDSDVATIAADMDGKIFAWNLAATALLGWGAEEQVGKNLTDSLVPPEFRALHQIGLAAAKARGSIDTARTFLVPAAHKNGATIPLQVQLRFAEVRGFRWVTASFWLAAGPPAGR